MESFVILVFIAVAGMGIAAAAQGAKRKPVKDAWRAAASTLRLDFDPGDFFSHPEIHGELSGHSVRVTTFTKGEESERHTRYRIIFRSSLGLGLRIRERPPFSGVRQLVRGKELSFDDTEFAQRLVIRATAPDSVISMLGPVRRHVLRDFYALFPGSFIDDTTLTWETDGVDDTPDRIVKNVRGLIRMAEDFDHWVQGPEPRPLQRMDEAAAAEVPEPASQPTPLPPDTELTGIGESDRVPSLSIDELLDPGWMPPRLSERDETNMSEEEHAHSVIEEPEPSADNGQAVRLHIADDHAVLETATPADTPMTPAEDDTTIAAASPPPLDTSDVAHRPTPIHPRDISRALFGERLMGDEMARRFTELFEGRQVLWPGTLRSVSTYPFDHIFGKERGARATFEIAEMADAYGARRVRAVVRVPDATAKNLIAKVGQRLLFKGTLYRCEAFMRTLYLLDGSVPELDASTDERS